MATKKQQAIETADAGDIKRFWQFVAKTDYCWNWTGGIMHNGYAAFSVNGVCVLASRFAYNTFVGQIPEKLLVCHSCDNPLCVNFERHLILGTYQFNRKDCINKKRNHSEGVSHPGVAGIKNGRAKLSLEEITLVKSLLPTHRDCDILRMIGWKINAKSMSEIRRGWRYKD